MSRRRRSRRVDDGAREASLSARVRMPFFGHESARSLLEQFSWLAPDPIPRTILVELEKLGKSDDLELSLAELRSFSLLQRARDATFDTIGQVHRLVQLVIRVSFHGCWML